MQFRHAATAIGAALLLAGFFPTCALADTVNFTLTQQFNNDPQQTDTFSGTITGLAQGANYGSQLKIGLNTSQASNFDGFRFGAAQNLWLTDGQNFLDFVVSGTQVIAQWAGSFDSSGGDGSYISLSLEGPSSFYLAAAGFCGTSQALCNKVYTNIGPTSQTITFSDYTVSPVPVPAAAWLMLSGLGGLGTMLRRKRTAA